MGFLQNSSFLQRSKQPRDCSVYSISSISAGISASPPVGAGPAAPPDLATSAWMGSWTSFIFCLEFLSGAVWVFLQPVEDFFAIRFDGRHLFANLVDRLV